MTKKILCALAVLLLCAVGASSLEKRILRLGILSKLNTTEQEFSETWRETYAPKNGELEIDAHFYETLNAMHMALNAGEIQSMVLPDATAQYVLAQDKNTEAGLVLHSRGMGLAFGFLAGREELRDKFNDAIAALKNDWTFAGLEGIYIASPGKNEPKPVKFENFPDAENIRVAVTGDLPPIDYISPDGTPAGFNTAILAAIGNYLRVNISLVEVDAGARTAALSSGRADAVFWYEVDSSKTEQPDVPNGVILSDAYYEWQKFIHVKKASRNSGGSSSGWNVKSSILDLFFGNR